QVYGSLKEAAPHHPHATAVINFASFRSSYQSSKEALLTPQITVVVIVAEGMLERQTRELIALAKQHKKTIIGPSTVGGIIAGQFRIGYAGGMMENIIKAKLYRPGSIGLISKSGGMMNELFNIIARTTNGIYEGIAIGGDAFPGSTLLDHIFRYEANPNIKLIVALSELGGQDEYEIMKAKKEKKITKPLIMWCSGTCAKIFPWSVQFGHAGAKADKLEETADAKNNALRQAGIIVPPSFEQLEPLITQTFQKLLKQGKIPTHSEMKPAPLPLDVKEAVKQGLVRKQTEFITTISSDIGEEPTYGTTPISEIVQKNYSLGDVISLLWFKKKFPAHISKYLELCIILTADHGPAVSGAHNAIVAARAGKDVISSLCSGLLTIGPRFGGAIDDAARYFKQACDAKTPPHQFVEEMKQKGILIPGIGHRVKSKRNPDKRVELLKNYAQK
ncbi:MAG: citrate/2-methylcitrate synthase, partial [Nanoarchaeota archaeon]